MNSENENFTFDPASLVKIVLENKELGLALVQIPLTILDNWISSGKDLTWETLPSIIGYYWEKSPSGQISVVAVNEETLQHLYETKAFGYQYAGPLVPPK